jgi:glyoxylase-like metal-dependent hydrolase (beta-lactamase superfamily II)
MLRFLLPLLLILAPPSTLAAEVLQTLKLADGIYALVGPTTNRTPENLGNNANFGVLVGDDGVLLIDPGGTAKGAQMIEAAVRRITDKPVTLVINTGGQDHRWLGNAYFKARGARVIASEEAVADQKARLQDQLQRLGQTAGDAALEGTEPAYADQTFDDELRLEFSGIPLELHHAGHAHTPGDIFVWLPEQGIVFSGDIVYMDRMLGVGSQSAHKSWIGAFEAMAALQPELVVPGHGRPGPLAEATADTYDYLVFLRQAVGELLDEGLGMESVGQIDQSRFSYLENYDMLKGRNAQRVYAELEWE